MAGQVKAICLSEKKGTAKIPVEKIEVIENHGFKNDAHAGSWHRQVSLLSYETREEFKKMGSTVEDGAFGENLLISGIDFNEIEIGTRLKIGDVILEITQLGKSCHNHCAIYHQVGKCIMPTNGLFSRVLKGGTIQLNDSVEVLKERDKRLRVAILTLSDKGSQGQREDLSGPYIQDYFKERGYYVTSYEILPDEQKEELIALFDEFEAFETPESKFAHAMDNLQPLMLNNSNGGADWKEHEVTAQQVYGRQRKTRLGSETLFEVVDSIIQQNIANGQIRED